MESYVSSCLERGIVEAVDIANANTDASPLYVTHALEHPWYDGGVVFDWTALHRSLKESAVPVRPTTLCDVDGDQEGCLITTLDVQHPWELLTLNAQASNLSCFMPSPTDKGRLLRFVRGAPGQRSARDDAAKMLANVASQLRGSGLQVSVYMSTMVISMRSGTFDALLKQTGSAYRALKQAGLAIDVAQSNLEPRAVVSYGRGRWSSLQYRSLREEDGPQFLVDAFYCWLQDRYNWLCEAPILPPTRERVHEEFDLLLDAVAAHQAALLPFCAIGTPEAREALVAECEPLLVSKGPPPPGHLRWSRLELRLFLGFIGLVVW